MVHSTAPAESIMETHGPVALAASWPATTAATAPHNSMKAATNRPSGVTRNALPRGVAGAGASDGGTSGEVGDLVFR